MSTISIFVNGTDRTSQVDWTSFQKTEVLTKDPDVCTFNVRNTLGKMYTPLLNDLVVVKYSGANIFAGYIISSDETIDGFVNYYNVTAKDYSQVLDRMIVSNIYVNQTAAAIISNLITTYAPALTAGTLNCPVVIPIMKFNYISVRECLKRIINVVGNYDYSVDYSAVVTFFPIGVTLAPFSITDSSKNYNWNSLDVKTDLSQLTNVIFIRGARRTGTTMVTEYFSGDGTTYTFPMSYSYPTAPTVTVSSVVQTVGNDGVDKDASFQCMWNSQNNSLRFTSGNIPGAGTRNIVITGFPTYPLLLIKSDSNSIATYGQWQKVIIDKNLQDQVTASQRADVELLSNSTPIYTLTFTTYVTGLVKGQQLSFSSVIRNLSLTLKIQQIITTLRTPTQILSYEITAVSAPPVGINEVLNQLLVKDPANQIDINTTELIERYYSFGETGTVIDAVSNPTFTNGPYKYNAAGSKWGFSTFG